MALTRQQIKEAFDLFDVDASGSIDVQEMSLAMRGLGFGDLPKQQLAAMINAIDTNGDGSIEFREFEAMMLTNMAKSGTAEECWRVYKLFDIDQKGRINFDDLKRIAAQEASPPSDAELRKILKYGSEYPNKGLSFEEWGHIAAMRRH